MKKFYITTSIAYTNAFPHIGFALESIQADVLARFNRSLGRDVFFLTGTDEHGIKVLKAAEKEKKNTEEFVNEVSGKFQSLKELLNLSNDDFIRTSDIKRHLPSVEKVWLKLKKNGDVYKKKYKGLYCSGCEAFITRKELVKGKCPIHLKKPEAVEEENYFFKLSEYIPQVKKLITEDKIKIIPKSRKNEILGAIKQGIEDISFSRPKNKYWGFFVPGDDNQIIYVWPDALTNYISAVGYADNEKKFKSHWPADIHCIGKDILKFHCLYWPAMLLSLKLALPKTIFVHGFITADGKKMSKSLGNVIDPFELVNKYGADSVRYYLLREMPSTEDGDFSYDKFKERHNADLSGGIGNLLARVRAMAEKKLKAPVEIEAKSPKIKREISEAKKLCKKAIEEFKFNEALKSIWDLISFCDKYINDNRPWEERDDCLDIVISLLFALGEIALMAEPFMPETCQRILKELEINKKTGKFKNERGKSLFPRI